MRDLEAHLWPWRLVLVMAAGVLVEVDREPVDLWLLAIVVVTYASAYGLLRASRLRCPAFCLLLFSLDLAAITAGVAFSGGAQSPLAFLYVFPVAVMAVAQGSLAAAVLGTLALGSFLAVAGPGLLLSRSPRDAVALFVVVYGVGLLVGKVNEIVEGTEMELARRLAALHEGIAGIAGESSIADLLEQSIAMGVELTGARYGAVAVWDENGDPVHFFTAGMAPGEAAHLGSSPSGTGLLGVVRDAPGPIRLADPRLHASASALPRGHPPLGAFLGVPIPALGNWKGAYYLLHNPGHHGFGADDERLCDMLAAHVASAVVMRRLAASQREMHDGLLEMLVQISDTREHALAGHSKRVSSFARLLGERAGLSGDELELVAAAGLLHDLGKIGVPDGILGKPGPLDDEERVVMMAHSALGAAIVAQAGPLAGVASYVRHHHERWDGDGYPDGLRAEQIPLGARVVALADTLDAITGDRPYRAARSVEEAVAEIERCSGAQFDPRLVEMSRAIIEEERSQRSADGLAASGDSGRISESTPTLAELHSTVQVAGWRLFTRLAKELDVLVDLPVLAERVLVLLCSDLDVSGAALAVLEDGGEALRIVAWHGEPMLLPVGTVMPRGLGLGWAAVESAAALAVPDVGNDPRFAGQVGMGSGAGAYIPLVAGARVEGVLVLYRPIPQTFGTQEMAYLEAVAAPVAEMMAVSRLYGELEEMARTDPLTQAANRGYGLERLDEACAHAARTGQPFAVLMLDLDQFKVVNDSFGHQVGDYVLREAVSCLREDLRSEDVLVRYGGDEFLVLALDTTAGEVAQLVRRISAHHGRVVVAGKTEVPLPAWSIGSALWPNDGSDPASLIQVADRRLYDGKQSRSNPPARQGSSKTTLAS